MGKMTYEEVKNYIEAQGYILLSDNYKNTTTKLIIKCPNGHIYKTTFSNFKQGKGCSKRVGNKKIRLPRCKKNILKHVEKNFYLKNIETIEKN